MPKRRDDDIFRKLKNEKPLVKSVSDSEFNMPDKSTFDLMLEKKQGGSKKAPSVLRSTKKQPKRSVKAKQSAPKELDIFSTRSKSSTKAKDAKHDIDFGSKADTKAKETLTVGADVKKKVQAPKKPKQPKRVKSPDLPEFAKEKTYDDATKRKPAAKTNESVLEVPIKSAPKPPQKRNYQSSISKTAMTRTNAANSGVKKVFRHEHKYYINYKDHIVLGTALGAVMRLDDNADEYGGYHIRSLYFDDVYETALAEKIAGTDNRCKYRIRIYNYSDGNIKLEKKQKHGKFIKKTSMNLTRPECDSLIAGDGSFLLGKDNELAKEFYLKMKMQLLRPRVIVDYWREAYVYPVEDVRVTFDIDLKGSTMLTDIFNPNTPVLPVMDNGIMVLEVKFNKYLPESIKCALASVGAVKRSAISKYVLCRKYD